MESIAQVVVVARDTRVRRDRSPDELHCKLVVSHLMSDHAEKVQSIWVIGLSREHPAIDCFGFLQPAGGVMRPALLDRRGYGRPVRDD